MKKKNHPGKAKFSKFSQTPTSLAIHRLIMGSKRYVEEESQGKEPRIEEWENYSIPSVVPDTPHSCDNNKSDSVPKGKNGFLNSPSTSNWDSLADWTEEGVCIICTKGGEVITCCFDGCVVRVHASCLSGPAGFDDNGNFYCPICSYKRAMSELDIVENEKVLAKEKVRSARECFSRFIGGHNKKESSERNREKEANQSQQNVSRSGSFGFSQESRKVQGRDKDCSTELPKDQQEATEKRNSANGTSPVDERSDDSLTLIEEIETDTSERNQNRRKGKRKMQAEETEVQERISSSGKSKTVAVDTENTTQSKDLQLKSIYPCCKICSKEMEAAPSKSMKSGKNALVSERSDDLLTQVEEIETDTSEETQNRRKGKKKQQEDVMEVQEGTLSSRKSNIVAVEEMKAAPSKSTKPDKNTHRSSNPALPNARRKKLPWTVKEEKMLKEGVKQFSRKINKNMPWKSILEYGSDVFSGSRTPADLKDKWRNMIKEGSRAR